MHNFYRYTSGENIRPEVEKIDFDVKINGIKPNKNDSDNLT